MSNFVSGIYLLNQGTDFDETCTVTLLGGWEELFIFWLPWPNFQGQQPIKAVKWVSLALYLCDARKQTLRFPNSGDKN